MNAEPESDASIRETAARWIVRRDRGLSAAESIEFELWLAADARHAAAMKQSGRAWSHLDRIPDAVARAHLADAARRRAQGRRVVAFGALAAAALIVIAAIGWWQRPAPPLAGTAVLATSDPRSITLSDGSSVRLNVDSEIVERFTGAERGVVLTRGEAHFTVVRDPARPFVVSAGDLRVRALGTAFNVTLRSARIEVLVTEGRVGLQRVAPEGMPQPEMEPLQLVANELAVAGTAPSSSSPASIAVTAVDSATVARTLAWQDALLRLGGATLAEIAREFERRTGHRVQIPDADLAVLRVGGRFRADDPEGFANLLAATFDIEVERSVDGALVLRKKSTPSR